MTKGIVELKRNGMISLTLVCKAFRRTNVFVQHRAFKFTESQCTSSGRSSAVEFALFMAELQGEPVDQSQLQENETQHADVSALRSLQVQNDLCSDTLDLLKQSSQLEELYVDLEDRALLQRLA